jgi:hypothetical protein
VVKGKRLTQVGWRVKSSGKEAERRRDDRE